MPTYKSYTARKEYVCSKCGRTIKKGEQYFRIFQRFVKPRIRCKNCRPRPSELTSSDKLSRLYSQQESLEDLLKESSFTREFLEEFSEALDSAITEVEEVGEEYEESADNMSEFFPDSPLVDEIIDKSDACEEWRSELENAKESVDDLLEMWEELEVEEKKRKFDEVIDAVEDSISTLNL